jgi:alkylation response protein AidB-like acyl-CoA dehydrogenase
MDFTFDEDQRAIRELAARILGDHCSPEQLTAVEAGEEVFDRALWSALAGAGLLGLAFPEDVGGAGLGFLEACLVVEEVGRRAAPVPVLESVVLGGLAVDAFGSPALRSSLLPGVAGGSRVVTAALAEEYADPSRPQTTASPMNAGGGAGWRLSGVKVCVPAGLVADAILVPAAITGTGEVGVFVVDAGAGGLSRTRQDTSLGRPEARLELDGVVAGSGALLGEPGRAAEVLPWIVDRATTAYCLLGLGACEEAVRLTAAYVQERHQFGRPLASFQAVGQRAADAYIDTQAIKLTAWQAAWRLSAGLPATEEVAIAKFWASEGGQRVVHAAQHLHGGVGVDRSYPVHRYFLLAKHVDLTLGAASSQLAGIGRRLAAATT